VKESVLKYFTTQIFRENQVLVAVLGICSSLGVTTRLSMALTMGLAVTFVTSFSSLFVSILRKQTPDSVRMVIQLVIISIFVIIVDQFLQAFMYPLSKVLSVFVGLIITNCVVMGRTESMAKNVTPLKAFLDGLGAGVGYLLVLAIIGAMREFLGYGELFGYTIIPETAFASDVNPDGYRNCNLMTVPPAAFFLIGFLIFLSRRIMKQKG
jgi:Na+-transporting NADH:ubiquinone oxidoreductase subunit D